jgi:hypothetical protein
MMARIAGLLLALVGAARAEVPACPPRSLEPLPAMARQSAGKEAAARARALVARAAKLDDAEDCDAGGRDSQIERALVILRQAVVADPGSVEAWIGLADTLKDGLERASDDPVLRLWLHVVVLRLRGAGWDGCGRCIGALADVRRYGDSLDPVAGAVFAMSLEHGPPGALGDAARAIEAGIRGEEAAWNAAKRYLDGKPIVVVEGFNGSGADEPHPTRTSRTVKGERGLLGWLEKHGEMPGGGDTMWCQGSCCRMPFIDYSPHMYRLSKLCFDAGLKLRRVETDASGM